MIYLNGEEITRSNLHDGEIVHSTLALGPGQPEGAVRSHSHTLLHGQLLEGRNVLAAELHQDRRSSGDAGFDLRLTATSPGDGTLTFSRSTTLLARTRSQGGEWSPLVSGTATAPAVPPAPGNLAISEIYYHPAPPSPGEIVAGFNDSDQFEFIEFHNPSSAPVDLAGLVISDAVRLAFPPAALLPGQYAVVPRNEDAFRHRFGPGATILTTYTGKLDNSGETVTLPGFAPLSYSDDPPWPRSADGGGHSLTFDSPSDWHPSQPSPGSGGGLHYFDWLASRPPGSSAGLLDFAFASSPSLSPADPSRLLLHFNARTSAFATRFESSTDLVSWQTIDLVLTSTRLNPDGSIARAYSVPTGPMLYFRVSVSTAP